MSEHNPGEGVSEHNPAWGGVSEHKPGGSDRGSYFIPKKTPQLQDLSTQKHPYIFLEHTPNHRTPTVICAYVFYCLFELMKSTIPKKISVVFS